jgi:hypothetical protein
VGEQHAEVWFLNASRLIGVGLEKRAVTSDGQISPSLAVSLSVLYSPHLDSAVHSLFSLNTEQRESRFHDLTDLTLKIGHQ